MEGKMLAKKMRILIADDEEGLRLSMGGVLELEGHDVVTVGSGEEAIEKFNESSFDIAFIDIKMPGMNGVETFKEIKKISPETVVIIMTAFAVKDLVKEAINEGAYACISKPFDMDKIIDTIKEVSTKPLVVVIDDDPNLCTLLSDRFRQNGFHVISKTSGMEGIEVVRQKLPDVIFLDIVMEGMDGIATYKRLKELLGDKCPKTIIMSAHETAKFEEARKLGVDACMMKPLNFNNVKDAMEKLLSKGDKVKICIVDDDEMLCNSLKKILNNSGYDVETAHSGNEIINKIKDEVFKLVILDIKLPDLNGLEVYEKIKNINSDVGIIFISGQANDANFNDIVKKNNYVYLHKPFDPENLIKMIENIRGQKCQ